MSCLCKNSSFSKGFKWRLYSYVDLWSNFQLNLTKFSGFIAPNNPSKMSLIGSWIKKSRCFFPVKSRAAETQKLALGIQKVYMDGPTLGSVKISGALLI